MRKHNYKLKRPFFILMGAGILAFMLSLILNQQIFRNRLCDALFIEAIILLLIAWLSYLKASKLAFIVLHPFKKKNSPQDWKDRVPSLGSPPPMVSDEKTNESDEQAARKERLAKVFRRDVFIAGVVLFILGIIIQYI